MRTKILIKEMMILGFFYILYLISTLYQSDLWGNLLSPVVGILSFTIIVKSTFIKTDNKINKIFWLLLALTVFNWFSSDLIWVIYELITHSSPEDNLVIMNLYNITNLLMVIIVLFYGVLTIKKWSMIQLLLDIVSLTACSFFMFYIIFLNKKLSNISFLLNDLFSFFIITLDLIIFILILLWYLSIRKGNIQSWLFIVSGGFFLYVITDFVYYYLCMYHRYIPNSFIDAVYMASFVFFAVGTSIRKNWREGFFITNPGENTNIGTGRKASYLLLLFPLLAFIIEGLKVYDIIILIFVYILHLSFSNYVQLAIKNEELLRSELEISATLEKEIESRTKELMDKNKELHILANQDSVTSLYNRRYLHKVLNDKIKKKYLSENIVFLLINLDRYKVINAMYGHLVGDQILIEMGNRLKLFTGDNVIMAKLSGDEFGIAVFDKRDYKFAENLAKDIISQCSGMVKIEQYEFTISMCIGISIFPLDATDYSSLLKHADAARRQARVTGYNKYISFDANLNQIVNHKNFIEIALKNAIYDKEFELYYQPQFSIPDKRLIGMEALLRFKTSDGVFISPGEFIPIAEETGYIIPIGEWVTKQAIKQIAAWNRKYGLDLTMGINVSIVQLYNENFIGNLQYEMLKQAVKPQWLDIELTESIAMESEDKIIKIVKQIKALGVSISIDDFGTGYSSLSYLKYLPLDRIKIAKELIDTIDKGGFDLHIVNAVHTLTKSVGIKMIAEGVETQEQLDILVDIGCDEIQGYLLSKPLPAGLCENMISTFQNKE